MEPGARALLHANQPSLRLPAALPPSPRPPSSALPPPACGAPSFPAGPPPPPPPASCSLAFPRVLPAAGKWNSATAIASFAGREPPRSPPRASSAGPGRKRAAGQSHPALVRPAPRAALRPTPTPGRLLGVGRGPTLLLPALGEEAKEPAFSCPLAFCWWIERVGQRVRTQANSRRARDRRDRQEWEESEDQKGKKAPGETADPMPALGRLPPHRPLAARRPLQGNGAAGGLIPQQRLPLCAPQTPPEPSSPHQARIEYTT
ncbi:transcription initiation factor TFIID subunit 4-like [Ailuropoda melanoleuca]|uniref:transcription initiation factor TFIID subunit 4-like n=1 Tax=Ailuropoda melanoleuca TaxID=9646 RepID=UPI001494E419|nr:transcription initiation factor TFIID subunit 4-like [Ailuropoda melanoleuca]